MRNPKQFDGSTTQSEAESVDNVHSRMSTLGGHCWCGRSGRTYVVNDVSSRAWCCRSISPKIRFNDDMCGLCRRRDQRYLDVLMLFRDACAQGQSRSLRQVRPQRPPRTSRSKRTRSMPSWVPSSPSPTTPSPGCGTAEISVPGSEPGNSWFSFPSESQAVPSPPHPHWAELAVAEGSIWKIWPRVSFPRNLGD